MLGLVLALCLPLAPASAQCEPELIETFMPDDPNNEFGRAVAVDGDVVAVGAPYDSETDTLAGAVYVYR
jgi:hypothetical protein